MNRTEGEKALKRYLKRSVGFSLSILVGFLMTGQVSLGADINKELQIQDLLKSIQIEKEELNEKLLELDKELAIVKNSKDSSIQFFLSTLFENRKSKKSDDNGFSDVIDDWEDSIKDKPNIDIPDIRDDVKPIVPDIPNPLPNEDSIVVEPDFDFEEIGNIAIGDVPNDIDINIDEIDLPVNEIKDGDFNIPTDGNISKPSIEDIAIGNIKLPNIDSNITTDIQVPEIVIKYDPPEIQVPNINIDDIKVTAPEIKNIGTVKIEANGFEQLINPKGSEGRILKNGGENDPNWYWDAVSYKSTEVNTIVENYTSYKTNGDSFNINVSQNDFTYGSGYNTDGSIKIETGRGEGLLSLNGQNNGSLREWYTNKKYGGAWPGYEQGDNDSSIGSVISDVIKDDVTIEGNYNFRYKLDKKPANFPYYVRMFLSTNAKGINENTVKNGSITKITEVKEGSNINISTEDTYIDGQLKEFNGNMVALTHHLYDVNAEYLDDLSGKYSNNFRKSYSVLLNSGNINLGNSDEGKENKPYSKNMIGMMVFLGQGTQQNQVNDKTINSGNINIYGTNSIGLSFEEYKNAENIKDTGAIGFALRDDMYVGNVNLYGENNYGFRMGNIFSEITGKNGSYSKEQEATHRGEYLTYFDKVKIYGTADDDGFENDVDVSQGGDYNAPAPDGINDDDGVNIIGDNIVIKDKETGSETIRKYSSNINVSGTNNIGMVVGKSLSSNAIGYEGHKDIDGINPYTTTGYTEEQIKKWLEAGNVNPIANFYKIKITVDGTNTIGFMRDKDYSENNKNDMIIDDKTISDINFSTNAKNSVLIRSEQYGIKLDRELKVNSTNSDTDSKNVVMQATAQTWEKQLSDGSKKSINSVGEVIVSEKGSIISESNNLVGMMASGQATGLNDAKTPTDKAIIKNNGKIDLTGNNNIGMAVLGNNIGKLEGGENTRASISIKNNGIEETSTNLGIYNEGTFNISKADINIAGNGAIGIYNTVSDGATTLEELNNELATVTINDTKLNIENGAIGIYSKGGSVTSESGLSISDGVLSNEKNNGIGVYGTNSANINLTGSNITINNGSIAVGADSGANVTLNDSNITYNGNKFALYTKDENSKITLTGESNINLGGQAYGMNIDTSRKQDKIKDNKAIDLGGATININSNDVTVFNIVNTGDKSNGITINSSEYNPDAQSDESIKKYVGDYTISENSKEYGYNIASIDGGTINLDNSDNNSDIIKRYKFQRSDVTMTQNLNASFSNDDITKFLSGQLVGIGMSSSSNIGKKYIEGQDDKTIGEQQREETKINISSSTLTVDNTTDKDSSTSSLGVYTNFGEVNLVKGKIEVEDSNTTLQNNIGIYSKNGSKITTDKDSFITVYGNNGIGIYAEATKEFYEDENGTKDETKNKFGGNITQIDINNGGDITLSGESGVGIYADGGTGDKGTVTNSGNITVGAGTKENASVGIYGINTEITNTGNITVGDKENTYKTGVGIYAINSNVTAGGNITLGSNATGIYLDGNSNIKADENKKLTFNSLDGNTTDRIGIYATGKDGATNSDININFDIDMGNVVGGKAIVADGRKVTNSNTISISTENGRGMRALDNATITNKGTIEIGNPSSTLENSTGDTASIGMTAANTNGKIYNNGSININSNEEIGIYVENNGKDKTGNTIASIGTINLKGNNSVAVLTKGSDLNLDGTTLSAKNINFGNTFSNNIGIYAENSNITVNEDISKIFTENQTNNILIAGVENSQITNNKTITVGTSDENSSNTISNNIGIYLKDGGSYKGGESGSIKVNNGNIGIYAGKGAGNLENINVTSDSKGIQTIGVVLNGENKENKNISGTVTLTNSNDEVVQGKNIGIYANNSNVIVEKTLTLNNEKSNGTGLYLNNSTLSGGGTIEITGEGKENLEGKISNSVGIYYTSSDKENSIISDNQIKVKINKSNTIGVYLANDSKLKKGEKGSITIGTTENITSNATGIVIGSTGELENSGAITLNNTEKSIGIASLGGKVINSGNITLAGDTTSDTGIYLSGNSELTNTGTISIEKASNSEGLGIGIYAKGENVKINSVGSFNMASGNVAIYSDGTNISSDIKLADSSDLEKNSGTIALVVKSDDNGILIGKEKVEKVEERMKITLAKGSTGIYALDSGVKISNVSIDATANEGKDKQGEKDLLSYGIYLGAGKEDNTENYEIDNTDISLVKGVGIVVNTTDKNTDTSLTLSNSTLNIDSYSEGDKAETGIGIYTQSGNITLAGGNTINTTYGVGIFGGEGSNINIGNGKGTDTLNIKGYSVGVYSKGGNVELGASTDIIFQKGAAHEESTEVSKGVGAYVIDGNITSSANINTTEGVTSENIVGLLGKQTENNNTDITISNKGNITLVGNSVIGIAGLGSENSTGKVTITNEGKIAISGNKEKLSTGIYGENAGINNTGTLNVGQFATGIFYTGTKDNNIFSKDITLNGTDSMGAVLKNTAGVVTIGNINGSTDRSLGVYLDNYKSSNTEIGDITLGNESMGLYLNNSSTTIDNVGNISVGDNGFGIASVGKEDGTDTVTIANNGTIKVGDFGTAVYVKDSTLNMNSLAGVTSGKNGTVLHVNKGTLNISNTINELTFDGNIGMILENGGDITSKNGEIDTINIINGGTGILVKGSNTKRPDILADNTTIKLGSGVSTGKNEEGVEEFSYSVGIYYQDANVISNNDKDDTRLDIDIVREENSHHTIGTIYDRTYGTIDNFNVAMNNSISDSIGTIIRRDTKKGNYEGNTDENKVVLNSGNNPLVDVNGQHNIGIIGKNSIIGANGDIKVGLDETSSGSIGVYLTGTDSNWKHSYTGTGDINVGSHSIGIYAKNYDATHNGNITASGKESVGIASVILDDEAHGQPHTITVNDSILTVKDGAIGIFGRDTNIDVNNGKLEVSGENSTGIASIKDGNINFDGSATISGKGSAGIYKNTVLDNSNSNIKDESNNTITVGKGDWTIDNTASGIVAISREKNENGDITKTGSPITVNNSSNMTLGDGAIGIYSAGENIVNNHGAITVGGAVVDGDKTYASIGIYMANGVGNTLAKGTNDGNITVEKNGGVGIQVAGYVDFTNKGKIEVSDGAEGLHSSYGATITNEGNITVTGKGTGMIASGEDSQAINNGTINLEKDNTIVVEDGENPQYNTSLIGMAAVDGGHIINGEKGVINVNDGVGMYVDENSTFTNDGTINVNNGVGIMGVGDLINTGKIVVDSENSNAVGTVELDENLSDKGSLVVDRENGILEVNDNFSNIGGILETDFDIKLNNPTVDITQGGAGFDAPNISGDIKLDSNFALEGDGISFSVEDFIDPEADININTSPLFKTDINEGDLTVNKVDYKDITAGNQFDNRDDSLDNILAGGGVDGEILKKLNYYLDSLGNTTLFDSEADRMLGAIGGNIYSNIQSRMQDISRTFDNSFEEMVTAPNPTYENTKYSLIYTNGDYENTNEQVVDYDYDIKGLNVMREYDLSEQGKRYGYSFGFTGAKFKFDDFSESEEDVYSLRGGAHRISSLDNGLTWFTRAELGYNHHRVDRKVIIPGATENIENRAWYGSYQVSLDNKLRKEIFANENSNFGAYTALNLEYGLFDDIKESGNLELKVKSNDYFSSKAVIGLDGKFSKPINDTWAIRLNGDINYSYDFGDNYDENDVRFRTQDSYYSLASEVESRDVLSGKVSIGLDKSDYMSIALHAQAFRDFRRDEDYWNAGLTFTYRFNNHATPEKFLDMHNYFEFDKSDLNSKDKENIKEMAEYINKNNIQGTLLIEGHTDDTGRASYNDKLSLRRANSVKAEFEKNLTNKENIQVKVVGYGEDKPEYKNISESAKSKNRRTQINILNK